MPANSQIDSLNLIPLPQKITLAAGRFTITDDLLIVLDPAAPPEDRFAADYMIQWLNDEFKIKATISTKPAKDSPSINIARKKQDKAEAYQLNISPSAVNITASDAPGVYYATQTLRQCLTPNTESAAVSAPCLDIDDSPTLRDRAIHYDTKHQQENEQYVENFIKELAHYKANIIVWEWEDKLAYESHPEVGAPGAFTIKRMQQFTKFAKQHHIQIVPLVQGLGHASYILKHPQHHHLREIPVSNWNFCPQKEGTYQLMFDLLDDAIEATPGSDLIHLGCDEVYELGLGIECGCAEKAKHADKFELLKIYLDKCIEHCKSRGRRAFPWCEATLHEHGVETHKTAIVIGDRNPKHYAETQKTGTESWIYAPNAGIEPLITPLFPHIHKIPWSGNGNHAGSKSEGAILATFNTIPPVAQKGLAVGSVATSWCCSGRHNQAWMPRFICAADLSWNANQRDQSIDAWANTFFNRYFGTTSSDLHEIYLMIFECAQFYYMTLQHGVWHYYNLGKLHLPDFPRAELEYNNYWRVQYNDIITLANTNLFNLQRITQLIDDNLADPNVKHKYDLELLRACAEIFRHNAQVFTTLADLELAIANASDKFHFADRNEALKHLRSAETLLQNHIDDRKKVYKGIVDTYEKTQLPQGLSLPDKPYVFARDRGRNFANRTPDMSFLIIDEEQLDMEGYLKNLIEYNDNYEKQYPK